MNRASVKPRKKSAAQSKKDAANNAKNANQKSAPTANNNNNNNNSSASATNKEPPRNSTASPATAANHAKRRGSAVPNDAPTKSTPNPQIIETVGALPPIRKMERAHTFFLTRKFSQIYNSLTTGSKENLSKIPEAEPTAEVAATTTATAAKPSTPAQAPFKFTRSLSMASIPLRQSFRRVFRENKLEKLHEENSTEKVDSVDGVAVRKADAVPPKSDDPIAIRPKSTPGVAGSSPPPPSQHRHSQPRERRSSFRNTLRDLGRTLSGQHHTSAASEKPAMNSKWSASLASLQQIDNMVSYEDLSFIDYDKFNTYEQMLAQRRRAAAKQSAVAFAGEPVRMRKHSAPQNMMHATPPQQTLPQHKPQHKPQQQQQQTHSLNPTANMDANFDQPKNLYRQSLDDRKLRFLSKVSRQSFRLSNYSDWMAEDWLQLDQVNHGTAAEGDAMGQDCVDMATTAAVIPATWMPRQHSARDAGQLLCRSLVELRTSGGLYQSRLSLKSKSLNHLDNLESHIGTQTECLSPKPVDYLEVEPSKMCCLSSSPTSSLSTNAMSTAAAAATTSSSIRKRIPSFRSQKKKPILTRSAVSSSEYFCVFYDVENCSKEREEFVPAVKGKTLAEALNGALLQRNLSFSQITISDNNFPSSMDLGSPPNACGVNQHTDVGNLAGKFLIVTEKEKPKRSGHALQKAASFGARQRPAKLFQSASTEDSQNADPTDAAGTSPSATRLSASQLFPKHSKQRWSGLFGLRNPQQNQLYELLNSFTKFGVPQSLPVAFNFEHDDLADALDLLENMPTTWKEFVGPATVTPLADAQYQMQMAIWELVTTEVAYIHALQTVTELFLACLEAIQAEHILTDVDQHKLFSNVREICETNIRFWTLYLYPMLCHSKRTGAPMCIDYAQPAFLTFDTLFSPYEKYCAEQSTCHFYCKELHGNNTLFQAYLAWCEGQKLCNRLRLADILVQPMQRLTKYSLLLRAIKKHIAVSDESALLSMKAMTSAVDDFVVSVNSHLTDRQKNERIKGIMARIESYDVVDSNNETLDKLVKEYSAMFDLCAPMKGCAPTDSRNLFMEGDLKFKDSTGKVDVHCFLLTDMLLVCKTTAKKGLGTLKVIRQPFFTDRLVIKAKEHTLYAVYLNEFNMPVTAFTLQCLEAQNWHEAINKTKLVYAELKQHGAAVSWDDGYNIKYDLSGCEVISTSGVLRNKSPLNSSIGSRISSLNNSHSGSVELTESKAVSVDFEKANSLSSDEGAGMSGGGGGLFGKKVPQNSPTKLKGLSTTTTTITSNTLAVQPLMSLGQSLPNLNLNSPHTSHNTLLVPGSGSGHSNLLSPSHRGISYPPPSPTRATLRRGFAFSASIKNPPLVKSRNVISQNSFTMTSTALTSSGSSNVLPSSSSSSLSAGPAPVALPLAAGSRSTSPGNVPHQQQHHQQQQQRTAVPIDIEHQIQNSHESDV